MTLDELLDLLAASAATADEGGPYSDLDHALQCADVLRATGDVELQVAGLVHDIGHNLGASDPEHGSVAASVLRPLLGERVARLVEAHVPAKRYLVAVEPGYGLSSISTASLAAQGGPLDADGVAAFESGADWSSAVLLRRADDLAKVPGRVVPDLSTWVPALREVAR